VALVDHDALADLGSAGRAVALDLGLRGAAGAARAQLAARDRVGAGGDTRRRAWQLSARILLLGMKLATADGCRHEQDRLPAPTLLGADPCPVGW
jgi:hypothetical protein